MRNFTIVLIITFGVVNQSCNTTSNTSTTTEIASTEWIIGSWNLKDENGQPLKVNLYPDGSALTGWESGKIGNWYIFKGNAYIQWKDGWVYILSKKGNEFINSEFAPGTATDTKPTIQSSAEKLENQT
jgi:hypothetical protein